MTGGNVNILHLGVFEKVPEAVQKKFGDALPLFRRGVHSDGSCWFHSVAAALNTNNYHKKSKKEQQKIGHNLRRMILRLLTDEYWGNYWKQKNLPPQVMKRIPSAEEIRQKLANNREWSDVYMILFTLSTLRINALFTDSQNNKFYCGVSGDCPSMHCKDKDWKNIFIMWLQHSHFEPIFQKLSQREYLILFDNDSAAVKRATTLYIAQCGDVGVKDILL